MAMKKQWRGLEIAKMDGSKTILEITKSIVVNVKATGSSFIYFEKMKDGTWRFTHTNDVLPDGALLKSLTILREEPNG